MQGLLQQAERIAEVVSCVGQQRDRVGGEAVEHLRPDQREIQKRRDSEGEAEISGLMRVAVPVRMPVSMPMRVAVIVVMIVGIGHERRLEQARLARIDSEARFKRKSHELEAVLARTSQGIVMVDADGLLSVRAQEQLTNAWEVHKTMTPADYLQFRDAFGQASPRL